jgi:hypothetical protein
MLADPLCCGPDGEQRDSMCQLKRAQFITWRFDGDVAPGGASADGDAGDLNADAAWDIFLPLDALAMV